MNWSGAKNWLIVLFVAINLFLVFTIIKSDIQSSVIEKQTIQSTVDILRKSNVFVDAQIIPDKMPKLGAIDVENSISDMDEFAKKMLGSDAVSVSIGKYASKGKRLSINGDVILYTDSEPQQYIENLDAESAQRAASEWLRERGFDMDMVQMSAYENEYGFVVRLEQKIDKYALLDSYFEITVTANGITQLLGSWFVPTSGQSAFSNDSARVKSVISVLLDFTRDTIRINRGSNVIEQIDLGYTTGEKGTYHKFATAMPVWRIRCSDGNEYYFEAR